MIDNQTILNLLSFHGKGLDLKLIDQEISYGIFGYITSFKITKRAKKSKTPITIYWKLDGHHLHLWFWGCKNSSVVDLTNSDSASQIQAFLAAAKKGRGRAKKLMKYAT